MASHVALEEAAATFAAKKVDILTGEHRTPEYLAINPHGKVPALRFENGRVVDSPWIMRDRFTVADPYALVFIPCGRELDLPVVELAHLTMMKDRLTRHPVARRALERQGRVLLSKQSKSRSSDLRRRAAPKLDLALQESQPSVCFRVG